ncbi:hypothetical protein RND81_03G104100 [Saponaria officinalis]|uniref:DUF6598 domain-containing protein n=1 Tax=Saponaria officinalis TaxID=3572 RepID=A0AAW1M9J0_SAPOF
MVGYEPDLDIYRNKDWKKIWGDFLKEGNEGKGSALSVPSIRPFNSPSADSSNRDIIPYHLRKITTDDYKGCLTTPLIQVFSVCVSLNIDVGKPCEVYGSIRSFEGSRPRFHFYHRGPEDSETVDKDGTLTLSLIGPHGGAVIPFLDNSLDFRLRDRVQGVDFINSKLELDPVTDDSYDTLLRRDVPGRLGVAHVYYAVFQLAHYATVQVTVTKNDDDSSCPATDIYGSIVAGYANGNRYCRADEDLKFLETRLFDKKSHQPLRVMLGTPIMLSRDVVVVPAYSTLTMEVNLWDSNHGKIAGKTLNFPAHMIGHDPVQIRTQYGCVEVFVHWRHAYLYLYNDRFMDDSDRGESSNDLHEMQKKPRVIYDQQLSSSFIPRDDSCLELLPDNGLASIEVNYRAIDDSDFRMVLFLRDPIGNLEVSRGSFGWHSGSLEAYMPWYSKRLCSVVRGDDGYAAVHYEIFSDASEACLEVRLLAEGHHDRPINLYGSLFGLYSGYNYSTSYDKKYYRSRLFDRARDRFVKQNVGSEIELMKSFVVVPCNASLIIEASLCVLSTDDVEVPIRGQHEFEIDLSNTVSKFIQGEYYKIEICVKFRDQMDRGL